MTTDDLAALEITLRDAIAAALRETTVLRSPRYLSDTVQTMIAAGEFDAAADWIVRSLRVRLPALSRPPVPDDAGLRAALERPDVRYRIRAAISNAYYTARNAGLSMEVAADSARNGAIDVVLGLIHDGVSGVSGECYECALYVGTDKAPPPHDHPDGGAS
jgi:hypothetical protein